MSWQSKCFTLSMTSSHVNSLQQYLYLTVPDPGVGLQLLSALWAQHELHSFQVYVIAGTHLKASVFRRRWATSAGLCPGLRSPAQEGHGAPGVSPEEGCEGDWGTGFNYQWVDTDNFGLPFLS